MNFCQTKNPCKGDALHRDSIYDFHPWAPSLILGVPKIYSILPKLMNSDEIFQALPVPLPCSCDETEKYKRTSYYSKK